LVSGDSGSKGNPLRHGRGAKSMVAPNPRG